MEMQELQRGNEQFIALGYAQSNNERLVYGYDFYAKQYRSLPITQEIYRQLQTLGFVQGGVTPIYQRYTGEQLNKEVVLVFKVKRAVKSIYYMYYNKELRSISKEDIGMMQARQYRVLVIERKPIIKVPSAMIGIMAIGREIGQFGDKNHMSFVLGVDRQGRLSLKKCITKEGNVLIPRGIEVIEDGAFSQLPLLELVVLPDTIKEIKAGAFDNCRNLKEISSYMGKEAKVDANFMINCDKVNLRNLVQTT